MPAAVLIGSAAPRGIFALRTWPLFTAAIRHASAMLLHRPFLPAKREMFALNLNCLSADEQESVYGRMVPTSGKQGLEIALFGIPVDAQRVRTPMLVINGTEDRLTPPSVARLIARNYRAEYREYREHAHYIMREPNWEQVLKDIHKWLSQTVFGRQGMKRMNEQHPAPSMMF